MLHEVYDVLGQFRGEAGAIRDEDQAGLGAELAGTHGERGCKSRRELGGTLGQRAAVMTTGFRLPSSP
ncbi:hypothetical protein ABIB17_001689 [Arthrobacter sp. UYEF6]